MGVGSIFEIAPAKAGERTPERLVYVANVRSLLGQNRRWDLDRSSEVMSWCSLYGPRQPGGDTQLAVMSPGIAKRNLEQGFVGTWTAWLQEHGFPGQIEAIFYGARGTSSSRIIGRAVPGGKTLRFRLFDANFYEWYDDRDRSGEVALTRCGLSRSGRSLYTGRMDEMEGAFREGAFKDLSSKTHQVVVLKWENGRTVPAAYRLPNEPRSSGGRGKNRNKQERNGGAQLSAAC